MFHYHCPYCGVLIQHRPRLAGERVACSKCKGAYYEPTDPLPGVKPEKAPAFEAAVSKGGAGSEETPDFEDVFEASVAEALGESASSPAKPTVPLTAPSNTVLDVKKCEPGDMVAELASRGQNAVLLFWNPADPSDAGLAYSKNMSRQQADDQLIQVAAHVMAQKWPDLHQLILNRLAGS
jgi:hypothetical protein